MKPIAITTGSHFGIGPEVIAKGLFRLAKTKVRPQDFVIFGDPQLYQPFQRLLPKNTSFILPEVSRQKMKVRPQYLSGRYIELAAQGCLEGQFSAMVTGPIDKNELRDGGYSFHGHTEMLQNLCRSSAVTMMMAAPQMKVSLVTGHIPFKDISKTLTPAKITRTILQTHEFLKKFSKKPKIAVLGLNPHSGDGGLFGSEEKTKILPAIRACRQKKIDVSGPFPPDGFFAQWKSHHRHVFDAVVCMYHDQALIPVKLWDFENCVNVTLGLPILRTSVDHGVGFDIVGKNKADSSSFEAAFQMARSLLRKGKFL